MSRVTEALAVLHADAVDAHRDPSWRYGVQHTLTIIERALDIERAAPQDAHDSWCDQGCDCGASPRRVTR